MNNDNRMRLGKMIKEARITKGWPQLELGKMLGYRYGHFVGSLENGKAEIPYEKIPALSELLDLNPRELLKDVMSIRHPEVVQYL